MLCLVVFSYDVMPVDRMCVCCMYASVYGRHSLYIGFVKHVLGSFFINTVENKNIMMKIVTIM